MKSYITTTTTTTTLLQLLLLCFLMLSKKMSIVNCRGSSYDTSDDCDFSLLAFTFVHATSSTLKRRPDYYCYGHCQPENLPSCYVVPSQGPRHSGLQDSKTVTWNGIAKKMPEEVALQEVIEFLFDHHKQLRPSHEDQRMMLFLLRQCYVICWAL